MDGQYDEVLEHIKQDLRRLNSTLPQKNQAERERSGRIINQYRN